MGRRCDLGRLRRIGAEHVARAGASNTDRAYLGHWRRWVAWCERHGFGVSPVRGEVVVLYLTYLGERRYAESTVRGALAAIRHGALIREGARNGSMAVEVGRCLRSVCRLVARAADRSSPLRAGRLAELVGLVEGYRATGVWQGAGKVPVWLREMEGRRWARDKALLLMGWGMAWRRSELAGMDWESVNFVEGGVLVHLSRSKRDQLARGTWTGVEVGSGAATCPVAALAAWQAACGKRSGAVWRGLDRWGHMRGRMSDRGIGLVVQRYGGLVARDGDVFSAHSLRAGWATDMLALGVPEPVVMGHMRHRDKSMLRVYYRPEGFLRGGLVGRAGL